MDADLRRIADAATPGPWVSDTNDSVYAHEYKPCWVVADALDNATADATFIAMFDPVMVAALLDVAVRADRLAMSLRSYREPKYWDGEREQVEVAIARLIEASS